MLALVETKGVETMLTEEAMLTEEEVVLEAGGVTTFSRGGRVVPLAGTSNNS
jgi:hypothetical protein